MVLSYKFKRQKLESGQYVMRPIIPITLEGKIKLDTTALIDSGCDITLVPEVIAEAIGLEKSDKTNEVYGYSEKIETVDSKAKIIFLSRNKRDEEAINIPVSIVKRKDGIDDDTELILGISGIFDKFNIMFMKTSNKILFKKVM